MTKGDLLKEYKVGSTYKISVLYNINIIKVKINT